MTTLAVARLTIAEAAKRRLLLTGAVASLAFGGIVIAVFWFLDARADASALTMSTVAATFLTVFGLYTVSFVTSLGAVFLAAGAVSGDVDSGILHTILARPLSRTQYLAGRWAGLAALVSGSVAVMAGALLAAAWIFADYVALDAVLAVALLMLQAWVLLSLALLGSTVLPTMANVVAVLAMFALAWLAGIVGTIARSIDNEAMGAFATAVTFLLPSDAVWRAASYYGQSSLLLSAGELPGIPFASSAPPPIWSIMWGVAYPVVVMGLAALAFSRRDL